MGIEILLQSSSASIHRGLGGSRAYPASNRRSSFGARLDSSKQRYLCTLFVAIAALGFGHLAGITKVGLENTLPLARCCSGPRPTYSLEWR